MNRRVYHCEQCGDEIVVYREDREPAYCSQQCARQARSVPTQNVSSGRYVRVSVGTRDALKQIRPDATLGETVAYVVGAFIGRVPTRIGERDAKVVESETGRYDHTTKIRVSQDCYAALTDVRDALGAESLGDVVATAVARV